MKPSRLIIALLCLTLFLGLYSSFKGQVANPDTSIPKQKVIALAKRIEEQQKVIESNQIKIDAQLADIYEDVRQTWVFARRAQR